MEDESVLADLDPDTILAKQVEQLEREKKELQAKLKAQEKKVDHFVRACHVVSFGSIGFQRTSRAPGGRPFRWLKI